MDKFYSYRDERTKQKFGEIIEEIGRVKIRGKAAIEYTNATTTQMLNAQTQKFDNEFLDYLQINK